MSSPFDSLAGPERDFLRDSSQPGRFEPMKATLAREPFSREGWIFERKLDGIRCIAMRDRDTVRLISRTGHELGRSYPELVEALGRQRCQKFVADGEIVAFVRGVTSFAKLQGRMQVKDPDAARRIGIKVFLCLFDLVHLAGRDTTDLPLRARKALLRRSLSFADPIRFVTHRNTDGERFFREACRRGLEGVIAKRADSRYRHSRSTDWLKFKCLAEQEFVIGGYTAPKGSRTDFGALLVGYNEDGSLRYAGKVGTGFGRQTLKTLGAQLRELERRQSPFIDATPKPTGTRWVSPQLVAQIAFSEWTRDGRLRQPRYLGLREDKPPREVVRERPR